ncbi:MAG: cAMP phosphodiesterases class-II-domain-containing protein [Olpidium bornovanus]|uniref:cAMP phosphodiesterases class-II-domain-containing protein n=1 Tax=Olpidium bornovanus TaxID=278681 RepID=A0A8H7ZWB9_9FUNG|nr:MAG: cAMP phosphodiesterases class-II-domain-containing protein [Olpidium bornovanus]
MPGVGRDAAKTEQEAHIAGRRRTFGVRAFGVDGAARISAKRGSFGFLRAGGVRPSASVPPLPPRRRRRSSSGGNSSSSRIAPTDENLGAFRKEAGRGGCTAEAPGADAARDAAPLLPGPFLPAECAADGLRLGRSTPAGRSPARPALAAGPAERAPGAAASFPGAGASFPDTAHSAATSAAATSAVAARHRAVSRKRLPRQEPEPLMDRPATMMSALCARASVPTAAQIALAVSLAINVALAIALAAGKSDGSSVFPLPLSSSANVSGGAGCLVPLDVAASEAETAVFTLSDSPEFEVIALGTGGGPDEHDVSSFLLRPVRGPTAESGYLGLDAGTVIGGLTRALRRPGVLGGILPPALADEPDLGKVAFFRDHIKGYCITHAHLGQPPVLFVLRRLVKKTCRAACLLIPTFCVVRLFGDVSRLSETISDLQDSIFNNRAWPNLADDGPDHANVYRYVRLPERSPQSLRPYVAGAGSDVPSDGTGIKLTIEAHPLSHAGVTSTAFLVKSDADNAGSAPSEAFRAPYVLFLGDVGPDSVELKVDRSRPKLSDVWRRVAPLVRQGQLRGILMECSYLSSRPDDILFGHLTPKYIIEELRVLASLVKEEKPSASGEIATPNNVTIARPPGAFAGETLSTAPLDGLNVVVFHVKSTNSSSSFAMRKIVAEELDELNGLGVRFLVPPAATKILLRRRWRGPRARGKDLVEHVRQEWRAVGAAAGVACGGERVGAGGMKERGEQGVRAPPSALARGKSRSEPPAKIALAGGRRRREKPRLPAKETEEERKKTAQNDGDCRKPPRCRCRGDRDRGGRDERAKAERPTPRARQQRLPPRRRPRNCLAGEPAPRRDHRGRLQRQLRERVQLVRFFFRELTTELLAPSVDLRGFPGSGGRRYKRQRCFSRALKNFLCQETDVVVLVNVRLPSNTPGPFGAAYLDFTDVLTSSSPFLYEKMSERSGSARLEEHGRKSSHSLLQKYGEILKSRGFDCKAIAIRNSAAPLYMWNWVNRRGDPRYDIVRKAVDLKVAGEPLRTASWFEFESGATHSVPLLRLRSAVIMGSRGMGPIKRTLLGSVSDYCAHHLPMPVVRHPRPPLLPLHSRAHSPCPECVRVPQLRSQNVFLAKTSVIDHRKDAGKGHCAG